MTSVGGFEGSTTTRWISHCAISAVVFLFLSGFLLKLGEPLAEPDELGVFFGGVWLTGIIWVVGIVSAGGITRSHDILLWYLVPLTAGRYYRKNAARFGLLLVTVYAAIPLLSLTIMFLARRDKANLPLVASWHFLANAVLFYCVALAVPLCETMTGKRLITSSVFLLRHTARWMGRIIVPVGIVLWITSRWWRPVLEPPLRQGIEALMASGTTGHVVVFLLSPMSGIAAAARSPSNHVTPWLITVFLSTMLGFSLHRICKAVAKTSPEIEHEHLEYWQQHYEQLEAEEEHLDSERIREEETLRAAFASPDTEDALVPDAMDALPYEERHSPEVQVVRHKQYWLRPRAGNASRSEHVFAFLSAHLWLAIVLVSWVLWLSGPTGGAAYLVFLLFFLLCAFIACAANAYRLRTCMATGTGLPLRWPSLIHAEYVKDLRRNALTDLLAAILLTQMLDFGIANAIVLFANFQVMRLCWYLIVWIMSLRYAGCHWFRRMYLCLCGMTFLSMFIAAITVLGKFEEEGVSLPMFPPFFLIPVVGLFLLACLCLVLSLWRRGTDVLGWPEPVKPFLEEVL